MERAIRLVVWDLDETFWEGTLTEGGVKRFIQAHHDLVIELAERGIMSSICSKNDYAAVKQILSEQGIWDYFIFPSIDWSPKGPRLRRLIEAVQLRPQTVLFIDDNVGNRAEASAIEGLRVISEKEIPKLINTPLITGKLDNDLTRLKQYKLLEIKQADATAATDNYDFLRSSDIRVKFIYDLEPHLDRVVELINRTNQLNYTKNRLPEDREKAKEEIRQKISYHWVHAGLVHVKDKYGDYGYVGFFMRSIGNGASKGKMLHFCFSCRTLGMKVERWIYDRLGRPAIDIVEPVLTDLDESVDVDWIRLGEERENDDVNITKLPKILLRGGCEMDALSHYFSSRTDVCVRETSFTRTPFFIRKDVTSHLLLSDEVRSNPAWRQFSHDCGFKDEDFASSFLGDHPEGSILIYGGWGDLLWRRYKHRTTGQIFFPFLPDFAYSLLSNAEDEFERVATSNKLNEEERKKLKPRLTASLRKRISCARQATQKSLPNLKSFLRESPPIASASFS